MFDAISEQGGAVNQMIGDGLMAVFGAPLPLEAHTKVVHRWVLIDGEARAQLGPEINVTAIGDEMFKGKTELVRVFAVDF